MSQNGDYRVKLSQIHENKAALRTLNREHPNYLELVDSIRLVGVLQSILVKEDGVDEKGEKKYKLIDGLHRYSASIDAGREDIPVRVQSLAEQEALEAQIILNATRVETKPVEYSKALERLMSFNPLMTISELSKRLAKSPTWLSQRLHLTNLTEAIGKLVDEDKLNLTNAYALAKLPPEEQPNFLDRAMAMSPAEFQPLANQRTKELKDAAREGRKPKEEGFVPVARLQKVGDIKDQLESKQVAHKLVESLKITNPIEAFTMALKWSLHLDPVSVEEQKRKDQERKEEREKLKEAKKKEQEEDRKKLLANVIGG